MPTPPARPTRSAASASTPSPADKGGNPAQQTGSWGARCAGKDSWLSRLEIEILPLRMQDRVLLESFHPRTDQVIAQAGHPEAPRAVDVHLPAHVDVEVVALDRIGQVQRLLVQRVEGLGFVAAIVALTGIGPVQQLHEVLAVGI